MGVQEGCQRSSVVSVILVVVFLAESPMFDGVHVCIMDVG